eukprot:g13579.t1
MPVQRVLKKAALLGAWCGLLAVRPVLAQKQEQSRISAKTVRLPNHPDVRFRIEAYGGSFSWESLMPDIVSVVEQGPGYAIVAPKNLGKSVVFARDAERQGVKPCDVYVSDINELDIVTPARRINVDDVDQLAVQGYDAERNLFTSLEGIAFDWRIRDHNILMHTQMRDTEAFVSRPRANLEDDGKYSDVVMVRGKATGQTMVSVKTDQLSSKDVLLTISENLMLFPTSVNTLPGAELQFGVKVYKSGSELATLPFVELPTPHFSFRSQDAKAVGVDEKTGAATAAVAINDKNKQQRSVVTVKDTRIESNDASASVTVSDPAAMRIVVRPYDEAFEKLFAAGVEGPNGKSKNQLLNTNMEEWNALYRQPSLVNLVEGRKYVAYLQVENAEYTTLALPTNVDVEFGCAAPCPIDRLLPEDATEQALMLPIWAQPFVARTVGKGTLRFDKLKVKMLKNIGGGSKTAGAAKGGKGGKTAREEKLFPKVKAAELQVQVYPGIEPSTSLLVLPPTHEFALTVKGGTGAYEYTSDSREVAVDGAGKVTTKAAVTDARVTIRDKANADNMAEVLVHVRELDRLLFEPTNKQVPFIIQPGKGGLAKSTEVPVVGIPKSVPSSGLDESDFRFHACGGLMPSAALSEPEWGAKIVGVERLPAATRALRGQCGVVKVRPLQTGDVTLSFAAGGGKEAVVPHHHPQELSFFTPIQVEFVNELPFLPPTVNVGVAAAGAGKKNEGASSPPAGSSSASKQKTPQGLTSAAIELGARIFLKFTQGPLVEKNGKRKTLKLLAADSITPAATSNTTATGTATKSADQQSPEKIAVISEETEEGFFVQCQDVVGSVILEGSIFLPSEQLETTTRAYLDCAKPDFARIFSIERKDFALRDAAYPMSAVCGKSEEHELLTVVYAKQGAPLLALKYASTVEWKSNSVITTPSDSYKPRALLKVDCPPGGFGENSEEHDVVVTASYLGKQDKVTLRPAQQVEVVWPGAPSDNLVFGAWYLFTIRGGSRRWQLKLAKSKELKIMPFEDPRKPNAAGSSGQVGAAQRKDKHKEKALSQVKAGTSTSGANATLASSEGLLSAYDMSMAAPTATSDGMVPSTYRVPECNMDADCRGHWHLTSEVLGEGEVRIVDEGLLGSKPIEMTFDFQRVSAIEWRRGVTQAQGELGKPLRVGIDMRGSSSTSASADNLLHPHLWKSSGLACRVMQGLGQNARELVSTTTGSAAVVEYLRRGEDGFLRFKDLAVGDYSVRCSTKDKGVVSGLLTLKIFPRLQLYPARLVGMPKQTAEFTLLGGASSDTTLRYTSRDPSVVSVEETTGRLKFLAEGTAKVEVRVMDAHGPGTVLATAASDVVVAWPKRVGLVAAPAKDAMKLVGSRNLVAELYSASDEAFTPALIGDPENGDGCQFSWKVDAADRLQSVGRISAELRHEDVMYAGFGDVERLARVQLDVSCAGAIYDGASTLKLDQLISVGRPLLKGDHVASSSRVALPLQSTLELSSLVGAEAASSAGFAANVAHVRGGSFQVSEGREKKLETGKEEGDGVLLLQREGREPGLVAVSARKIDEVRLVQKLAADDVSALCQENCLKELATSTSSTTPLPDAMQLSGKAGAGAQHQGRMYWASSGTEDVAASPNKLVLPVGSSTIVAVSLFSTGLAMLFPDSGVELRAFSAHNSVVSAEQTVSNSEVRLRANEVGCSAVQFEVQHHEQVFFQVVSVCTKRETLLPVSKEQGETSTGPEQHNLLLHEGARSNFFVASKSRHLVIRVREYNEQAQHKKLVEKEFTDLLLESRKSSSGKLSTPGGSTTAASGGVSTSASVRVVSARRISQSGNAHELFLEVATATPEEVEAVWYATSSALGPYLEMHWDMKFGIRPESSANNEETDAKRCPYGRWSSSNPRVVSFENPSVGAATAKSVGQATVSYCGEFEQTTTVLVEKVAQIRAPSDMQQLTSRGTADKVYRIPLALLDEEQRVFDTQSPFFSQQIRLQCEGDSVLSSFFEVAHIEPSDVDAGPACTLKKRTPETSKLLGLSERIEEVKLRVAVLPTDGGPSSSTESRSVVATGDISLPFVPGFVILDVTGRELDLSQGLRLTASSPAVSLRIWTGGRDVRVRASDRNIKVVQEKSTETLHSVNIVLQDTSSTAGDAAVVVEGEQGFLETIQLRLPGTSGGYLGGLSGWQFFFALLAVIASAYYLFGSGLLGGASAGQFAGPQGYSPQHYESPFRKADESTFFDNSRYVDQSRFMDRSSLDMSRSPPMSAGRALGMNASYM